jgi:hypothetical protein
VLETEQRRKETNWKRLGCVQPNNNSGQVHRTVRWCTGQCPVCQAGSRWTRRSRDSTVAYDYNSPDCSVSQRPPAPTVGRAIFARHVVAPTVGWAHRIVRCAPDSVRCANQPRGPTVGCAKIGRKSRTGQLQWLSGGAPDCPLHHPTEGKFGLPGWSSTAPSCLRAIKGTPRRMEEQPKHSLSILKHPDSTLAHSLYYVSDLGSIRVVHSPSCHLSSSLHLCAWLCCIFGSCVCCSSQPYSVLSLWSPL